MNPYLIEGPAVISFSGGRTSGYVIPSVVSRAYDLADAMLTERAK